MCPIACIFLRKPPVGLGYSLLSRGFTRDAAGNNLPIQNRTVCRTSEPIESAMDLRLTTNGFGRDCSAPRGRPYVSPGQSTAPPWGNGTRLRTQSPNGAARINHGFRAAPLGLQFPFRKQKPKASPWADIGPPRWDCVKELLVQGLGEAVSIGFFSNIAIASTTDRNRPVGTGTTRRNLLLFLNHNLTLNPNLLRLVPVRRRLAQTGLRL